MSIERASTGRRTRRERERARSRRRDRGRARGRPRPLPRPQERRSRSRCAGARPRERDAAERHPRAARGGGRGARAPTLADAELDRRLREEVRRRHAPRRGAAARPACTRSRRCGAPSRTRSSASATRCATTARSRRSSTTSTSSRSCRRTRRARRATRSSSTTTHVLRTETSPSQIHIMEEKPPPIYMVSIGRVYRRDAITATRYPIFHQFEGLAVDKGLTLADLKGTLLHVMRALYGPERRVRFRTHYFPFTEPSIEPDVSCGICGGAGCRTCKFSGWIEMGGAGMVDPQRVRERRPRPRGVERLRVRLRARAHRAAAPRHPGHPRLLGGRPPRLEAVLMRVPLSWLREYVAIEMPLDELATRLSVATAEVEGIERRGVADADGNLDLFRVGRVLEAGEAPERRPAPADEGRRRRARAARDRLRRVELRRRRDGRRRAARRGAAERAASSSGARSAARSPTG